MAAMPDFDITFDPLIPLCPSEPGASRKFEQNQQESVFFRKIPTEVRLLIYEYAVYHEEGIWPQLVSPRSNKYVDIISHHEEDSPVFQVNLLRRTCRQILWELEKYQVFYRINDFQFDSLQDFHVFLASLTPAKRHALTTIVVVTSFGLVEDNDRISWFHNGYWSLPDGPKRDSIITLLRDCRSLHTIVFDIGLLVNPSMVTPADKHEFRIRKMLERIKAIIRGDVPPEDVPADFLWRFPQFRLVVNTARLANFHQAWDATRINSVVKFNSSGRVLKTFWVRLDSYEHRELLDRQFGCENKTDIFELMLEVNTMLRGLKTAQLSTLPTIEELSDAYAAVDLDVPVTHEWRWFALKVKDISHRYIMSITRPR
ncbi:hypothetical protein F5Y05DRAFT_371196 [Hypoxylon sp. FL0543]|nr:hypothetical protein F5Y05DRAFT_371196 [Hypoxylon sp. FL0543]